jgi:putative Mn2+ efflux pump MntP
MSALSHAAIALSMSADAFAVSVSKGAVHRPCWRQALRTGAIFGTVEAITPLIGWALGLAASRHIQEIDHWVAFVILAIVGGKLLYEGFSAEAEGEETAPRKPSIWMIIATAIGTSIDALAVGVSLAFMPLNIWMMALAIGSATFLMATIGMLTGHYIGKWAGKWAERLGGVTLIAIGTHILLSHTGVI